MKKSGTHNGSSFLAGVLVTISKAHNSGSFYPKLSWSDMVKRNGFCSLQIAEHKHIFSQAGERWKMQMLPSLINSVGLKIVVLCSGEYMEILQWKFGKHIMEMLVLYYSRSLGSALLCWTQQKLVVIFCRGNVATGAVPHTRFPLILTWQHNGEN